MRGSIRLLVGVLAVAALRHLAGWPHGGPPRDDEITWWGALSFALAAVVDPDRAA